MPRSPRVPFRRRVVALVQECVGEPVCYLFDHGRPVLREVEARMRQAVPPRRDSRTAPPVLELGVVCSRCGTRVGD